MRFTASNAYDLYRPSKCARRVAWRHRQVPESNPRTPFDELLARLGERHERAHLASLAEVTDLSRFDAEARERETLSAIQKGAPAIYQARFRASVELGGETCEVVGIPDFLIHTPGGYVIRDSKLSRRINEKDHPEVLLQLQLYGWLFEQAVGKLPGGLEVHSGSGVIVSIPQDAEAALSFLEDLREKRLAPDDAYEPVGWSKCGSCRYFDLCWKRAEDSDDISLLSAVDQARALKLRERGILTIGDISKAFEDPSQRDLFYEGKKKPKLKDSARRLLNSAESFVSDRNIVIARPGLPLASNYAMLDLEGLPPFQDDTEKIYLWGLRVFGEGPSGHLVAQAGFGEGGDREGWREFLRITSEMFERYGDLPVVHWSTYERTKLDLYVDRYGDVDGIAARLRGLLVDLLSILRNSIVLPLPSNSLKVVEKHVGFQRKLPETGGAWAICRYIEAIETADPLARDAIMSEILAYNEEDLEATWAVMEWMRGFESARVESDS